MLPPLWLRAKTCSFYLYRFVIVNTMENSAVASYGELTGLRFVPLVIVSVMPPVVHFTNICIGPCCSVSCERGFVFSSCVFTLHECYHMVRQCGRVCGSLSLFLPKWQRTAVGLGCLFHTFAANRRSSIGSLTAAATVLLMVVHVTSSSPLLSFRYSCYCYCLYHGEESHCPSRTRLPVTPAE